MNPQTIADPPVLTVSQLSNAIKHCLETTFPLVWLQGEVSNCKPNVSGHLYFSLKDQNAQISAIMFRGDVASLKSIPKDGTQVIVRGEVNVYPMGGKYQMIVRELRPVGLGELLLKLEELKIKLNKLGWFKKERKRQLPKFPKRIGVVTSPTGAAIQDMLNILNRRYSGFHLILNPVKVQGEGAAQEIAQAIEQFNTYDLADVLIIGRGGGSIEDLWAFNEEVVAQAIFNSRIPTISAVGHETDHCIADYVADVRAPTPSAAAEIVIAEKSQQITHLAQLHKRMQQTVMQLIRQDKQRLAGLTRHPFFQTPYALLGPKMQQVDMMRQELDDMIKQRVATQLLLLKGKKELLKSLNPLVRLGHCREKLISLDKDIQAAIQRRFEILRLKLKHVKESLDTVNPKNLLTKGYCILFSKKNFSAITSVHSVEEDEQVRILLSDGNLNATVNKVQ
ncbi:MAG: exodeoxyribonuclease VII large subunit [Parachlamydiaceae bacterium]